MAKVVLITGGNLGDVEQTLKLCNELIGKRVGRIIQLSSVVRTKAWGFESEDDFLNQVVVLETTLLPEEVLSETQQIEKLLGRKNKDENSEQSELNTHREYHSREIDIDILFYDDIIINSSRLKIPHVLMHQRAFVLEPLCELMPDFVHPQYNKTMNELRLELI